MSDVTERLVSVRSRLDQETGKLREINDQLAQKNTDLQHEQLRRQVIEKARAVVQTVAQQTQAQLTYRLSESVNLAMETVFDDPYRLSLRFDLKRNRTEAVLLFERGGNAMHPLSASGGGAVDAAAFGLRVALWSLASPRPAAVLILDEPFRFLSRNLQTRAADLLREVASQLGVQLLLITHEEALAGEAQRVFEVRLEKGVSRLVSPGNESPNGPPRRRRRT